MGAPWWLLPYVVLALSSSLRAIFAQDVTNAEQAEENDIIIASYPPYDGSYGSSILIYSVEGRLKSNIASDLSISSNGVPATMGITGDGQYVVVGSRTQDYFQQYRLAITRIAGGNPKFLGYFTDFFGRPEDTEGWSLDAPNMIASGKGGSIDAAGRQHSYIFASDNPRTVCGTEVVKILLFTSPGQKEFANYLSSQNRFDVFPRGVNCTRIGNVVRSMRTFGTLLYIVMEESPGLYVLRSFDPYNIQPASTRSDVIVQYSGYTLTAISIDSEQSFVGQASRRAAVDTLDSPSQSDQVLIRVVQGQDTITGTGAPATGGRGQLYGGGLASYPNGKGILAVATVPQDAHYNPFGLSSVYRIDPQHLQDPQLIITLPPSIGLNNASIAFAMQVVPRPRPVGKRKYPYVGTSDPQ